MQVLNKNYCAKGAVGSKPEVCMRVWFLRVHHPPLLKAPTTDRLGLPISTLRIMCLASHGANTAVCVIVGSSNVVAASLENIAHFRTRPDKKDLEKKASKSHDLACLFFSGQLASLERWRAMGKGFEQPSSASEMAPRDA